MAPNDETESLDRDRLRRVVEVALAVAEDRAAVVHEMRACLECGDERRALQLLRGYVGLEPLDPALEVRPG